MYKLLAFIGLLLIAAGCNVDKRNVERMQVYAVRYPAPFKVLANTLDPCFTGVAKSDTITKINTAVVKGDTVVTIVKLRDTIFKITRIQLPGQITTKTLSIHDTVTNNRAIQAAEVLFSIKSDSLVVVKTQLSQTKHIRATWMWIAIGCMFLIVVYSAIKIYIFFTGVGITSSIKKII
jgi:hypothetical protein